MNLGERLRVAFQMCGLSAPQVSRATGVKVATINALLRRESSERSSFLEDILTVLPPSKVSHDWLRTGRGTPDPKVIGLSSQPSKEVLRGPAVSVARGTQPAQKTAALATAPIRAWEYEDELPEEGGWVFIPKLGIIPAPADGAKEEIKTVLLVEEVQAFRAEWIREDQLKPAALAWSQAQDASMAKVIYEGDSYVIDTSDTTIVDGKTYSIWYGGAEKVRRLFRLPGGGLRIKPENDEYERLDLGPETAKHLRIIGRVVHRAGKGGL